MEYTASDIDIMARTIWGEDRGGGALGMEAVAWVIKNRANYPCWWGHDIQSVCKAREQFDCWNNNDPNYPKILAVTASTPSFALAQSVAQGVLDGSIPDPTGGAVNYYAKTISAPAWAKGKTATADIGGQLFFAA